MCSSSVAHENQRKRGEIDRVDGAAVAWVPINAPHPVSANMLTLSSYTTTTLCGYLNTYSIRYALKKNDIIWEFFPNVGPPPLLGTPYPKKFLVFILHFRT